MFAVLTMGLLHEDLRRDCDAHCETHISWVFLRGERAFKVKKPVALGFLDFSTQALRKRACEAEVDLNRRLAPDVYLGVVRVTRDATGQHRLEGDGQCVDYAVEMRRLQDSHRADELMEQDRLTLADVDRIAERLVAFHAAADTSPAIRSFGEREVIGRNVRENIEQTATSILDYLTADQRQELVSWQTAFLDEHGSAFEARLSGGRIRDGHGDLKLEHVYLEPSGVVIVDCIEFNERFRYGDVAADLAFLSMDLSAKGRPDLSERLLATYAALSNDYDIYTVIDFYQSYRAFVKAKISTLLVDDPQVQSLRQAQAQKQARQYFMMSLASEHRRVSPPCLVLVGGLIGSGKSTIADDLSAALAGPTISSDRVRKHLLGLQPQQRAHDAAFDGSYTAATTERVYEEVMRRARVVLSSQRPVVLDASFRSRASRSAAAALADELGVPFRFVECQAPIDVLRARLRDRARGPSVSDGRAELLDAFAKAWESETTLEPAQYLPLDTTLPAEQRCKLLQDFVPMWVHEGRP